MLLRLLYINKGWILQSYLKYCEKLLKRKTAKMNVKISSNEIQAILYNKKIYRFTAVQNANTYFKILPEDNAVVEHLWPK